MSLVDAARQALNALGSAQVSCALTASDGPLQWSCELASLDRLGCEFTEFVVRCPNLRGATPADLEQRATRLAQRVNYLLEPLRPIEVDPDQCVVQMRSSPPQVGDDGSTYYELLVRAGELRLHRYRKSPGTPREAIPAQVTREVLLRLVGDFAAAAA